MTTVPYTDEYLSDVTIKSIRLAYLTLLQAMSRGGPAGRHMDRYYVGMYVPTYTPTSILTYM